jgi:hypothetical protein
MKTITLDQLKVIMDKVIDDSLELPWGLRPDTDDLRIMVFLAHKIADEVEKVTY